MRVEDYAPGSTDQVRVSADLLRGVHTALNEVSTEFRAIFRGVDGSCGVVFTGAAASKFAAEFESLPGQLDQVAGAIDGVASTLSRWQYDLEDLQERTRQALSRAELARQRRDTAQSRVDNAASRISTLKSQLETAKRTEAVRRTEYETAATAADPTAPARYQTYLDSYNVRTAAANGVATVDSEKATAQADRDSAGGDLASAERDLEQIRNDHGDAARRIARSIKDADLGDLRNKSMWEKAAGWAGDRLQDIGEFFVDLGKNLVDMVDALLDGDWDRALYRLTQVLDSLGTILAVVMVVATVVLGFAAAPFLIAAFAISAVAFAAKAALYFRDARNPDNPSQRAVSGAELAFAGGALVVEAIGLGKAVKVAGVAKTVAAAQAKGATSEIVEAAGKGALTKRYGAKAVASYSKDAAVQKSRQLVLRQMTDARHIKGFINKIPAASLKHPLAAVVWHESRKAATDVAESKGAEALADLLAKQQKAEPKVTIQKNSLAPPGECSLKIGVVSGL